MQSHDFQKDGLQQSSNHPALLDANRYEAFIFDMDGVVTQTAKLHAQAWEETLNEFIQQYNHQTGKHSRPFNIEKDYLRYIDGKPREEGIHSFLKARKIMLPWGSSEDSSETESIYGLGQRKNDRFQQILAHQEIQVYPSTLALLQQLRAHHKKLALISASKNAATILEKIGLSDFFDVKIDGVRANALNLKGKPHPDIFLQAAKELGTAPQNTVVIEDALAGVEAAHRGEFDCIIGIDRSLERHRKNSSQSHHQQLLSAGANMVVNDLSELTLQYQNTQSRARL